MMKIIIGLCFLSAFSTFASDNCELVVPVAHGKLTGIDVEIATILYDRGYQVEFVEKLTDESINGRNYITYRFSGEGSWYQGYRCDGKLTVNKDLSTGATVKVFEDTYYVENQTSNFSTCKRSYEVLASKIPLCKN